MIMLVIMKLLINIKPYMPAVILKFDPAIFHDKARNHEFPSETHGDLFKKSAFYPMKTSQKNEVCLAEKKLRTCEFFEVCLFQKSRIENESELDTPPLTFSDKVCLRPTNVGLTPLNRCALKSLPLGVDTLHIFRKSRTVEG